MSKYFWETDRIRLRQVEPDDWEVFYEWDFDSEVSRSLYRIPFPKSVERYKQDVTDSAKETPKDDKFALVVEEIETGKIAGSINVHTADSHVGTFAYGIAIRPDFQRKGYASETILLILKYYFEVLRYQKCTIGVHEWNTASIVLHERLGFVKEGQHRRMVYTQGKYWDLLFYGITVEEWREKYGANP